MKKIILFTFFFIIVVSGSRAGDPVIIMPVGNSITAGEHYRVPPLEERTGYRKVLYEMLIDSGYNVDFVGSQEHGIRPLDDKDWYDWNNEAYPGKGIVNIAGNVKNALPVYKPDILLVHVGTNGSDWNNKPGQVMDMLDTINKYSVDNDHPMIVFLCKIINRFYEQDQAPTTQFNIDVADTVATRTGDKIKIILVDMENGAGLDYTDSLPDPTAIPPYEGGDMWGHLYPGVTNDKYHPNDKGNTKMAVKFYEELVKELEAPARIENNKVEGIEFISTSDTNIIITWISNFLDEDGFIIERAIPGSEFSIVDTANANTRFLIDSSANATNEYKYRIKAFNATGESLYSSEVLYVPTYYNLTISVTGEGTASPSSGSFLSGTSTTLTATAADGWEFHYWSGITGGFDNPVSVTFNSDLTLSVKFREVSTQTNTQTSSVCRFYPNPVNDELKIELQNEFSQGAVIQLLDNTGRLILNRKVKGSNHILDMENLPPGIYLIKVSDINEETIIKRITKQ